MASKASSNVSDTAAADPQKENKPPGSGSLVNAPMAHPDSASDGPSDLATKLGFAPRFIPQWDEQVSGLDIQLPADTPLDQITRNLPSPGTIKTVYCDECELTWLVGHNGDKFGAHPHHNSLVPAAAVDNGLGQRSVVVYIHGNFDHAAKEGKGKGKGKGTGTGTGTTICHLGSGVYFGPDSTYNSSSHGFLDASEANKLVSELYAAITVLRILKVRAAPGWLRVLDEHRGRAELRRRWAGQVPGIGVAIEHLHEMQEAGRDMRDHVEMISQTWKLLDEALKEFGVDVFRLLAFDKYPHEQLQTMYEALQHAVGDVEMDFGENVAKERHHPGVFGYDVYGAVDASMWTCCENHDANAPGCQTRSKNEPARDEVGDSEQEIDTLTESCDNEQNDDDNSSEVDEVKDKQALDEVRKDESKNKSKPKKKNKTKKGKGKSKSKGNGKTEAEAEVESKAETERAKPEEDAAQPTATDSQQDHERDLRVIIATDSQMLYETVAVHMEQWDFNEQTEKFKSAQGKTPKNNDLLVTIRRLQKELAAAPPKGESVKVVWYKISKKENDDAVDLAQTAVRLASLI